MDRRATIAVTLIAVVACAPSEAPRIPPPTAQPVAAEPVVPATSESSKVTIPAAAVATPPLVDDTTPLSQLPKRFIADIPGWLGFGIGYMFADTAGADPNAAATLDGLGIFPEDTTWKHVGRSTPLVVIGDSGRATVFSERVTGHPLHLGNETMLKVRPLPAIPVFWIVPESEAKDVEVLPIRDSLSPNKLTRVWSAGGARIRLQRTDRLSARMVAEYNGHSAAREGRIGINAAADSSMGVGDDTDSILDLKKGWMVPSVYAAIRFGANGPIMMLFSESGYECDNVRVVVFRPSGIEWIEEPHYYGDCTS